MPPDSAFTYGLINKLRRRDLLFKELRLAGEAMRESPSDDRYRLWALDALQRLKDALGERL